MRWYKPRSIRGQLIFGLIILEGLLVVVFATLLVHEQASEIHRQAQQRIESQVNLLALQAQQALSHNEQAYLQPIVHAMLTSPSVRNAMVTSPDGRVIASSNPLLNGKHALKDYEKAHFPPSDRLVLFRTPTGEREAVVSIHLRGNLVGYAWVYENGTSERQQIYSLIRITIIFGLLGCLGAAIIASVLADSITRPLKRLKVATRRLIHDPETKEGFPLEVTSDNEAAELTHAFNLMVSSMEEQRAGLNDTLALLDSMLENAPIGFAFFDRKKRFVRVNQFMADTNQMPIGHHLGRTITDLLPAEAAASLDASVEQVFTSGLAVRDLELAMPSPRDPREMHSWLVNVYPVKSTSHVVRWVGVIIVETTERRRSEEALRKSEKLAAAGRLAASVAHEINNPLEAVTNLLYLLRREPSLDRAAQRYVKSAQFEVARVAEMTQQTLRFYRQSTLPVQANLGEIMDSVLTLFQGKAHSLQVDVLRDYGEDIDLYCLAGEMRQLFANLVGNALDAMSRGGRLHLAIRRSTAWKDSAAGIRVFVADNGCGMDRATRLRIFEPFFTTKDATGTGLGLWVSDEILQKHSGTMRVFSRPAGPGASASGTVFMIFFPDEGVRRLRGRSIADLAETV